ncbi:hypothetical protein ACFOKF_25430 [Sphingobium rhizovicinum]|uniref:Uncharacterized protein n=1 Tax=Sphingobium rhizovicinum TaxID=432308 RepID=A0ABV7NQ78_9SPHN
MGGGGAGAATAHALMGMYVGTLTLFDPNGARAAANCARLCAPCMATGARWWGRI